MKALIVIRGEQVLDGQAPDLTEMTTVGTLEPEENGWVLQYRETQVTGMAGTETALHITPAKVTIPRTGTNTGMLVLEKPRRHHSEYSTPYGMIDLGTYATDLDCRLTEKGGILEFRYTLGFNGSIQSCHAVHITVQEEKTPCPLS